MRASSALLMASCPGPAAEQTLGQGVPAVVRVLVIAPGEGNVLDTGAGSRVMLFCNACDTALQP